MSLTAVWQLAVGCRECLVQHGLVLQVAFGVQAVHQGHAVGGERSLQVLAAAFDRKPPLLYVHTAGQKFA